MINYIWFYSLLSFVVAYICLKLLFRLRENNIEAVYKRLFFNLIVLNILQTCAYAVFSASRLYAEYLADVYLIALYFFFSHLVLIALHLSPKEISQRLSLLVYISPIILTILHLSGFLTDGYRVEKNTLMHNDGELSWLFDVYALVCCVIILLVLTRNILLIKQNRILKSKNILALLSFAPLALAIAILIVLSATPYAVPATVVVPLITLYTAQVFYAVSRSNIAMNLSMGLRLFWGRLKLALLILDVRNDKQSMKNFKKSLERQIIIEALENNDYLIKPTANDLEINHTTLRYKIKEHEIPLD